MEKTLTAVCKECKNYFYKSWEKGSYEINGGVITLQNKYLVGQYIRIVGSVLNDGVYKVNDSLITLTDTQDEEFNGIVYGLAIPQDFIEIVSEIEKQINADKNDKSNKSLTSESYSNYSYSRAINSSGVGASWKEVFASQLNNYRKMFEESGCL